MTTAPVVVGVDGSAAALRAVDHAVEEAQLRHRPLHVVYADTWARHPAWVDIPANPFIDPQARAPHDVVQEALDRAAARSSVTATGAVVSGHPAAVLLDESRWAVLLVLGYRRHGHLPGTVVSAAGCPVVVVRDAGDASGAVLVGVNGSAASDAAVGFAFEEAAQRGAPLVALRAWTVPVSTGPGDMVPLVYDPAVVAEEAGRALSEALVGWRAKYPEVPVTERLVPGRPGPTLLAASARARLVVVGARGHQVVPGWLVGSVPHLLLHQGHCPVAVVPGA
jgi:nucleotide-binding universal stress UspA family protein